LAHFQKSRILDATRVKDNVAVVIKRVQADDDESLITRMLSSPERRKDPHNHAVPVLDYFVDDDNPSQAFLVMPLLRPFDSPPFDTVNEALDFVRQILEVCCIHHRIPYYTHPNLP
jgi:serine/threonine protein kinase